MQHMTGSAKWQKQARLVIISRKMEASHFGTHVLPFPQTACWLMIVRVGVDKPKVSLFARLHQPLSNRFLLWLWFFPYPSKKSKKRLCHASYCVTQTWKASIFFERWGDSNLCNEKFSTQHRGWTFSPPFPGSALEPSRLTSQRRKSAASCSCGWCGATCALHSHKHKLLALRERTWHNNKHTRASFISSNGPSLCCRDSP